MNGNSFALTLQPFQIGVYCLAGSGRPIPKGTVTDTGGLWTGPASVATATVNGLNSMAGPNLEVIPISFPYYPGTTITGTPLTGASSSPGTHTVLTSFAGILDDLSCTAVVSFTIT
jgi:hypothetical protein